MRIKDGFLTYMTGDEQIMVAAGTAAESFRGMARSNKTAAFLVDCLRSDITREELIQKMVAKYDAPETVISADVDRILNILRSIGALDE